MKYLNKFSNKDFKMKMLKHCDWNYKETAKNFENVTNIDIVMEKEYYTSFADVYGDVMSKDEYKTQKLHMWNDYGQQYDRSSLRKDFNPAMTKSKVYSYNGKKCH